MIEVVRANEEPSVCGFNGPICVPVSLMVYILSLEKRQGHNSCHHAIRSKGV